MTTCRRSRHSTAAGLASDRSLHFLPAHTRHRPCEYPQGLSWQLDESREEFSLTRRMGWLSAIVFTLMAAFACSQTDAGVTTKVKAKLAADDAVKAYQIDVDTRDKVVTLSGNVESDIAKTQASRLARETEGVARVVDNVTVTREPVDTPNMADRTDMTDPAITAAVKAKLLGDPVWPA